MKTKSFSIANAPTPYTIQTAPIPNFVQNVSRWLLFRAPFRGTGNCRTFVQKLKTFVRNLLFFNFPTHFQQFPAPLIGTLKAINGTHFGQILGPGIFECCRGSDCSQLQHELFEPPPGMSWQILWDFQPKCLSSLVLEGGNELLDPHPFTWKIPTPLEDIWRKKFVFLAEESESSKGGWKTQERGKHTINPLPKNGFGASHLWCLPPPLCSLPVIFLGGNGHRPNQSHWGLPKLFLEGAIYPFFVEYVINSETLV